MSIVIYFSKEWPNLVSRSAAVPMKICQNVIVYAKFIICKELVNKLRNCLPLNLPWVGWMFCRWMFNECFAGECRMNVLLVNVQWMSCWWMFNECLAGECSMTVFQVNVLWWNICIRFTFTLMHRARGRYCCFGVLIAFCGVSGFRVLGFFEYAPCVGTDF